MQRINRLTAGLVVALLLIGSACGGDGDDESAAPGAANGKAQSGPRELDRFLKYGEIAGKRQHLCIGLFAGGDMQFVVGCERRRCAEVEAEHD